MGCLPGEVLAHRARETLRGTSTERLLALLGSAGAQTQTGAETGTETADDWDFAREAFRQRLSTLDPSRPSFWAGLVVLGDGARRKESRG